MENGTTESAVLLVDDDEAFRRTVGDALETAGYTVLAAASGEEAVELAARHAPRAAILDVALPGISGYHVCRHLRGRFGAGLPILFVSAVRLESFDRVAGLLIGADEYVTKPCATDELLIHLERLIRGSAPVAPQIAARLTARELEILRLLAEGRTGAEIAAELVISRRTVTTHIENLMRKLQVKSRGQAIALAYRSDLLAAPVEAGRQP